MNCPYEQFLTSNLFCQCNISWSWLSSVIFNDSTSNKKEDKNIRYFTAAYFNSLSNKWGLSVVSTNQNDANKQALARCSENSNDGLCEKRVIADFKCLVVAYSEDKSASAVGSGQTIEIAGKFAVKACNDSSVTANCSVTKNSVCGK